MKRTSLFGENMEYFDGTEWKKIDKYKKGEKVLIYDRNNGRAMMSIPIKYIKDKCEGINVLTYKESDMYKIELSDETVFIGDYRDCGTPYEVELKRCYEGNFSMFSHAHLYSTFKYDGDSCMLSQPRLEVMIYSLLLGEINNNICKIKVDNRIKYTRLLREGNIKYKINKIDNKVEYRLPRDMDFFLSNPLSFTEKEMYIIIDTINSMPKMKYIESDNSKLLDFFQMIYALHGNKSYVNGNKLYVKNVSYTRINDTKLIIEHKECDKQYSFTTKTGYIILRCYGTIFIFEDYKN